MIIKPADTNTGGFRHVVFAGPFTQWENDPKPSPEFLLDLIPSNPR